MRQGMRQNGMGWAGQDGTGRDGMGPGMRWDGLGRTGQDGMRWNGMG